MRRAASRPQQSVGVFSTLHSVQLQSCENQVARLDIQRHAQPLERRNGADSAPVSISAT